MSSGRQHCGFYHLNLWLIAFSLHSLIIIQVAKRRMPLLPILPTLSTWAAQGKPCSPWIHSALDPQNPVVFLDMKDVAALEEDSRWWICTFGVMPLLFYAKWTLPEFGLMPIKHYISSHTGSCVQDSIWLWVDGCVLKPDLICRWRGTSWQFDLLTPYCALQGRVVAPIMNLLYKKNIYPCWNLFFLHGLCAA